MTTIGTVFVQVVPSTEGFAAKAKSQVEAQAAALAAAAHAAGTKRARSLADTRGSIADIVHYGGRRQGALTRGKRLAGTAASQLATAAERSGRNRAKQAISKHGSIVEQIATGTAASRAKGIRVAEVYGSQVAQAAQRSVAKSGPAIAQAVAGGGSSQARANTFAEAVTGGSGALGRNLGRQMSNAGRRMTFSGTGIGSAAALYFSGKFAAQFESAISRAGSVMGDFTYNSEKRMNSLREAAMDVAKDYPLTNIDAGNALGVLAKAGLSYEKSLQALRPATEIAVAGQIDLAEAASYVSATVNTFGLKGPKAIGRVGDSFVKAANVSNAEIGDIANSMTYAGSIASEYGLSVEETATAFALLGKRGIVASKAGTQVRSVLSSLINPTDENAQLMADLGIDIVKADGSYKGLVGTSKELAKALDGINSKAKRQQVLSQLFGKYGSVFGRILDDPKKVEKMLGKVSDSTGEAAKQAQRSMSPLERSFVELKGSFENFLVSMGNAAAPTLIRIANGLDRLAESASNLPPGVLMAFAAGLGALALSGPLLWGAGGTIAGFTAVARTSKAAIAGIKSLRAAQTVASTASAASTASSVAGLLPTAMFGKDASRPGYAERFKAQANKSFRTLRMGAARTRLQASMVGAVGKRGAGGLASSLASLFSVGPLAKDLFDNTKLGRWRRQVEQLQGLQATMNRSDKRGLSPSRRNDMARSLRDIQAANKARPLREIAKDFKYLKIAQVEMAKGSASNAFLGLTNLVGVLGASKGKGALSALKGVKNLKSVGSGGGLVGKLAFGAGRGAGSMVEGFMKLGSVLPRVLGPLAKFTGVGTAVAATVALIGAGFSRLKDGFTGSSGDSIDDYAEKYGESAETMLKAQQKLDNNGKGLQSSFMDKIDPGPIEQAKQGLDSLMAVFTDFGDMAMSVSPFGAILEQIGKAIGAIDLSALANGIENFQGNFTRFVNGIRVGIKSMGADFAEAMAGMLEAMPGDFFDDEAATLRGTADRLRAEIAAIEQESLQIEQRIELKTKIENLNPQDQLNVKRMFNRMENQKPLKMPISVIPDIQMPGGGTMKDMYREYTRYANQAGIKAKSAFERGLNSGKGPKVAINPQTGQGKKAIQKAVNTGRPVAVKVEAKTEQAKTAIQRLRNMAQNLDKGGARKVNVKANVRGKNEVQDLKQALSRLKPKNVRVKESGAKEAANRVQNLIKKLDDLKGKSPVTIQIRQSGAEEATGQVNTLKGALDSLPRSVGISISISADTSGVSIAKDALATLPSGAGRTSSGSLAPEGAGVAAPPAGADGLASAAAMTRAPKQENSGGGGKKSLQALRPILDMISNFERLIGRRGIEAIKYGLDLIRKTFRDSNWSDKAKKEFDKQFADVQTNAQKHIDKLRELWTTASDNLRQGQRGYQRRFVKRMTGEEMGQAKQDLIDTFWLAKREDDLLPKKSQRIIKNAINYARGRWGQLIKRMKTIDQAKELKAATEQQSKDSIDYGRRKSASGLASYLQREADKTAELANIMGELRGKGYSPAVIQKLTALDPSQAYYLAKSMLNASEEVRNKINGAQAKINKASATLGGNAAQAAYGKKEGVSFAKGLGQGRA